MSGTVGSLVRLPKCQADNGGFCELQCGWLLSPGREMDGWMDGWRGLKNIEGVSNVLGYNGQFLEYYYENHKYLINISAEFVPN